MLGEKQYVYTLVQIASLCQMGFKRKTWNYHEVNQVLNFNELTAGDWHGTLLYCNDSRPLQQAVCWTNTHAPTVGYT